MCAQELIGGIEIIISQQVSASGLDFGFPPQRSDTSGSEETHHSDELEELDDGRVQQVVSGAVVQQRVDDRLEQVSFHDVAVVILVLQADDSPHEAQRTWTITITALQTLLCLHDELLPSDHSGLKQGQLLLEIKRYDQISLWFTLGMHRMFGNQNYSAENSKKNNFRCVRPNKRKRQWASFMNHKQNDFLCIVHKAVLT